MLTNEEPKLKLNNDNPYIIEIIELARSYVKQLKYDDAIKLYSSGIEFDHYYELYERRAFIYYKLGKFHDAIEDYSFLISNGINKPKYLRNRGALYKKTQQYKKCKKDLLTLIEIYKVSNDYESINYIEEELAIINDLIKKDESISYSKKEESKVKSNNDFNNMEIEANFIEKDNIKINLTFEKALDILRDDWRMIGCIENPSEELQNFAININSMAIDYIKDPCELVLNNPYVIKYLKDKK